MEIIKHLDDTGILTLTLNRPEKLNALNHAVLVQLHDLFQEAKQDSQVKGVMLTGTGKAFCAGADIQELARCNALNGYEFAQFGQAVFSALENLGKPSIALVNGLALGGGCELIQAASMRIASTQAKFGQPEVKLGVIPGYGGTQRLTRLIGQGRALDLCLTGRMIDAQEALAWGLVTEVHEGEVLLERGQTLMRDILQRAPLAVQSVLEVIHRGAHLSLPEALHLEALHFSKTCASQDKQEGVAAFLEKRTPAFQGE